MTIRIFQKGFHYSQDGPGNRLVIHLQGCNMRCPWCSNPEGMASDSSQCKTLSIELLVQECIRSRPMFFDGGGVTLTGGEVLFQLESVKELAWLLHENGIHVAIETNATHPRLSELFLRLDLLIADLKHMDAEIHRKVTGISNEIVLENLRQAARQPFPIWIRIPLINGFNASTEYIPLFTRFFMDLLYAGADLSVECLPYHEYGKDKWKRCGLAYSIENGHVSAETLSAFETTFKESGINVIRT